MNNQIVETQEFQTLMQDAIEKSKQFGKVNEVRVKEMLYAYKVLQDLTKNTKAKVTYELHEDCKGMGAILIDAKKLSFTDFCQFDMVTSTANNFEVYAKTNGTVQMNLAFYGLLNKEASSNE